MNAPNWIHTYKDNPYLAYADLPFEWKGTPVDRRGRFANHEYLFVDSIRQLLKWQLMTNPQKEEKQNESWRLQVSVPNLDSASRGDCIIWLGHASFFIRLAGYSILVDPVFFDLPFIKRQSPLPISPDQLGDIDYILISHDHRDHCDIRSLKSLAAINAEATFLTGLGLDRLLSTCTKGQEIQAAGWYQQYRTSPTINISYVPSRHWGRRYWHDTNCNLWGGFVIQGAGRTLYFAGDSGY